MTNVEGSSNSLSNYENKLYGKNSSVNAIARIINTLKDVIKFPTLLFLNNFIRPAEYVTPTYAHLYLLTASGKTSSMNPALD